MISSSRLGKLVALGCALGAHGAVALVVLPEQRIEMEGSAGGAEAALGSSFTDMAAGTLSPEPPPDTIEAETPDATEPPETPETVQEVPPEPLEAPQPETAQVQPPQPVETPVAPTPLTAALPVPLAPVPDVPLAPVAPSEPEVAQTPPPEPEVAEVVPPEPEVIESEAPETAAVDRSVRPRPRSEAVAQRAPEPAPKRAEKTPVEKPERKVARKPQGNSDQNARAGQASGSETAKAVSSGQGGRSNEAGNAAASNYPGLVMRKLARAQRPRVNSRGTAVVAFRLSNGGGLASVSLARSSGSAALDEAAVRLVQRAAPFPAPPSGAQRSFSIQIKGR